MASLICMMTRPIELETILTWLLQRSVHREPKRRLNEVENQLTALASNWRPSAWPLVPAVELRMASVTRDQLGDWVEAQAMMDEDTMGRWSVYQSALIIDERVRAGWLRLSLSPMQRKEPVQCEDAAGTEI